VTEVIHSLIQLIPVLLNPKKRITLSRNDHSMVSNSFSVSIFKIIKPFLPCFYFFFYFLSIYLFFFLMMSKVSWAMIEFS
jgi:hypothetical protein